MSVDTRKPTPRVEVAELVDDTLIMPRLLPVALPQRVPGAPGVRVAAPVASLVPISGPPRVSLLHPRRPVRVLDHAWPPAQVEGYRRERCPVCRVGILARAEDPTPACCAPSGEAA